jgi:peroxiredoxin Q/BCP
MNIGVKAPEFSLPDQNGKIISLNNLKNKRTLIYFYPKDNTPGCTVQACSLRDNIEILKDEGLSIIGVSADSIDSHKRFVEKYSLPFTILSDTKLDMVKAYGAWGEKSMYGRKYMGVIRSAVIVGPDLNIEAHWPKIQPLKTVPLVREWVKTHTH